MDILSVLVDLVHQNRGDEALSISAGKDDHFAPEWCSLNSLVPPQPVTREEIICAYHLFPVTIQIKSNIVTIPHKKWVRLDVK